MPTNLLASSQLKTLYTNNFVHTNVSGLSADPKIRIIGDDEITDYSNGDITIQRGQLIKNQRLGGIRIREYLIEILIQIDNQTDSTKIEDILDELDRIHGANNESATRTYECDLEFDWDTNFLASFVNAQVKMTYLPETIPT